MKARVVFLIIMTVLAFNLSVFSQEAEPHSGPDTTVTTERTGSLPDPHEFFPVDFLPEPVYEEIPEYPEEARGSGIKISVFVKSLVGTDGNVIEAIILTSSRSELGFDEAALAAAYKCTYKPALQGDQPVPYWVTSEYEFIPSEEELAAIAEAQAAYWETVEAEKVEAVAAARASSETESPAISESASANTPEMVSTVPLPTIKLPRVTLRPLDSLSLSDSLLSGSLTLLDSSESDQPIIDEIQEKDDSIPTEIPAEMIYEEIPEYPQSALQAGKETEVWLKALVDEMGKIREVTVLKSTDSVYGFDDAAVEAAYKWEFRPAMRNDSAIAAWVAYSVEFSIETQIDSTAVTAAGPADSVATGGPGKSSSMSALEEAILELDSAEYLPEPDEFVAVDSPAVMIYKQTPIYPKQAMAAGIREMEVWVKALVDKNGTVRRVEVSKSPEPNLGFGNAALEAAYKCRFQPAIHSDSAVAMWTAFNVEFDLSASVDSSAADQPAKVKLPDAIDISPAGSTETDETEAIDSVVSDEPAAVDTTRPEDAGSDTLTEQLPIDSAVFDNPDSTELLDSITITPVDSTDTYEPVAVDTTRPEEAEGDTSTELILDDSSAVEKPDSTDWPIPVEKAAEIIHEEPPVYPEEAKKDKIETSVWIKARLDTAGVVRELEVFEPSDYKDLGFEEAALEAARKYEFKPAIQDGRPVEVWVTFQIKFELENTD